MNNSNAEKQARVDLAAAFRLAVRFDLHEGICNHFTLRVPGTTDKYFLNPFGVHWSQVRASDLLIVDDNGEKVSGEGEVERTAAVLHGRVHSTLPHANCVLHTHMPHARTHADTRRRKERRERESTLRRSRFSFVCVVSNRAHTRTRNMTCYAPKILSCFQTPNMPRNAPACYQNKQFPPWQQAQGSKHKQEAWAASTMQQAQAASMVLDSNGLCQGSLLG